MSSWNIFNTYLLNKLSSVRWRSSLHKENQEELQHEHSSDYSLQTLGEPIFSIPEEVLLNIFSYLPASDVVTCSEVCKLWHRVSSDRILWEHTLNVESRKWPIVASGKHWGGRFSEGSDVDPELHPKSTYLCCTFEAQAFTPSFLQNLGKVWRSLVSQKKPKFAMVGPGLDSKRTSRIVHKMVHNKCQEFEPVTMIPGVNGFGTGLTFKLTLDNESHMFDLITLYASRQKTRGIDCGQNERIRSSFLCKPLPEDVGLDQLETTDQVRTLFDTIDGIVFVIDAEDNPKELSEVVSYELKALMNSFRPLTATEGAQARQVPIVVFSLIQTKENQRKVSAFYVAQGLKLFNYSNSWYVQDCIVNDMPQMSRGFLWLVQKWVSS